MSISGFNRAKSVKYSVFPLLIILFFTIELSAQNIFDAIRYSQIGTGKDAWSSALPGRGVSQYAGSGTFMDNPAAAAFAENSHVDFSLVFINAQSEGQFLGNNFDNSNGRPAIGNLHYSYKYPTNKGSLVIGGGYNRVALFDRYLNAAGFNDTHSITDLFAQDDYYYNAAFNTFAIDTLQGGFPESALRIDGFRGIDQYVEVIEQGQMGEWSLYSALEFRENFMVGISVGYQTGTYNYRRNFNEIDTENAYNFNVTDYDIDFIQTSDRIDTDLGGLMVRLGAAYKLGFLQLGGSIELPSMLQIREDYSTEITTIFDREETSEPTQRFDNSFEYQINRPVRYKLGATLTPSPAFALSAAYEYMDYSNIEFDGLQSFRLENELSLAVTNALRGASNYHVSASYNVPDSYELRAGYSIIQSAERDFDLTEQEIFSLGAGIDLYQGWQMNFSIIGNRFQDVYTAYEAFVTGDPTLYALQATESIWRSQIFVGFNYSF